MAILPYNYTKEHSFRLVCNKTVSIRCLSSDIAEAEIVRETKHTTITLPMGGGAKKMLQQRRRLEQEQLEQALQESLQQYEEALMNDNTNDRDPNKLKQALIKLRTIYEDLQYWDEALHLEQLYMEQYTITSSNSNIDRADSLQRQGTLYRRMNNLLPAGQLYQQALDILNDNDNDGNDTHGDRVRQRKMGQVLMSMAGLQFQRNHVKESMQLLQKAQTCFAPSSSNNNEPDESSIIDLVMCLQHQGLLHRSQHDFASARDCYEQALTILDPLLIIDQKTLNDEEDGDGNKRKSYYEKRQGLQLDLADMLAALDQNEQACELYQRILIEDKEIGRQQQAIARGDNDNDSEEEPSALEGLVLHNLGRIHAQSPETRELALEELTRALEIKQKIVGETHIEVLKTLNALGALYGVMESLSAALRCFQQALLIARIHSDNTDEQQEEDETIMLILRNIAILKGEKVAKWGEGDD